MKKSAKYGACLVGEAAGLYLVVMPAVARTDGLAQHVARLLYYGPYRPVRASVPRRHLVRRISGDYMHFWCGSRRFCPVYGDRARSAKALKR